MYSCTLVAELGLRCRGDFSCSGGASSLAAVRRLLVSGASPFAEHGLWVCRPQPSPLAGSAVVVHSLSCSTAGGIFLDQGLNRCPLR